MRLTVAIGVVVAIAAVGTDPSAAADRSAGLRGNPGQFFGPDAYPPEAMRNREQGRVVARLRVDRAGKVTDCQVIQSSGSTALDERTCAIAVARVTFTPATDEQGSPIASSYTLPVRWVLPIVLPQPRRSTDEREILTVAADDRVVSCTMTVAGRTTPMGASSFCALPAGVRARTGPGRLVLTLQRIVQFAHESVIPEVRAAPGSVLLGLRRAAIDILPDGTAANERIVEVGGPASEAPDPIATLPKYQPAAETTSVMVMIALTAVTQQ